ncbi:DUF3099 domain-containing protein [Micrococcus porci]|uniref:DUF3099 domain-containing protein n=1 Tax=Micrococcus porci TaxID=2856555 RepID=UPI001CCF0E85|nr:DUF3099 domain-containing protein [Micrococcus porci]UBH23889.1 DUF3099 domain-containing protein [Micrococcus porci]
MAAIVREPDAVQGVTTAAAPRSADRDARTRVYVVQMAVRTACFIAALFTHGWWQILFILGAVVLPYVAVVRVNNTGPREAGRRRDVARTAPAVPALPAEPSPVPTGPVVLVGEVVEDDDPAARRALPAGSPGETGRGRP